MTRKSLNYNLNYKQCIMYVKCVALLVISLRKHQEIESVWSIVSYLPQETSGDRKFVVHC
jgi:hypothetical protein